MALLRRLKRAELDRRAHAAAQAALEEEEEEESLVAGGDAGASNGSLRSLGRQLSRLVVRGRAREASAAASAVPVREQHPFSVLHGVVAADLRRRGRTTGGEAASGRQRLGNGHADHD